MAPERYTTSASRQLNIFISGSCVSCLLSFTSHAISSRHEPCAAEVSTFSHVSTHLVTSAHQHTKYAPQSVSLASLNPFPPLHPPLRYSQLLLAFRHRPQRRLQRHPQPHPHHKRLLAMSTQPRRLSQHVLRLLEYLPVQRPLLGSRECAILAGEL